MRTTLYCQPLLLVCCLLVSLPARAGESGHNDQERPLVAQGVLGTVNVLRELDVHTFTNRVTVTASVEGRDSTRPEYTIDGSGKIFRPNVDPSQPLVLTYTLPGLRTVSSLVITYEYAANDSPPTVRLEGSSDSGKTWFELFQRKARKGDFLKCFRPAQVNMLRLTQDGDGSDKCCRRTMEVFVYADPDVPLPLFGGDDSGAFSFLRDLWYADKITQVPSPENHVVWTGPGSGMNVPDNLFRSEIAGMHRGCWGEGKEIGKRLYLRFDLERAYPMNCGLIGCVEVGQNDDSWTLAGQSQAEFYTANGRLDPSTLTGSSIKDLTGQGWILQQTWDKDPSPCKGFLLERPGKYNQMLLVWDCKKRWENNRFGHLEMFGAIDNALPMNRTGDATVSPAITSCDGGIVIDNGDPEYSEGGPWEDGKIQGDYYRYGMDAGEARKTTSAGSWAKWTPTLPASGKYRVYLWHIVWNARGQVTIEIEHDSKTETLKRNTGDGHSGWNNLGDYDFTAGTSGSVKVTLEESGTLYADAVKFLPLDRVDQTTFPPYPKPDGSTPRVDQGNIVICGEPRLILYGETLEEVMTHPADVLYYGDQFDKWRRQGLNTVAAILQWNAFEPRKDQYEYAMIDGLIDAARERNMHLIIVWFGTWRNLQSNYVPRYVWDEKIAFPALKEDGMPENGGISPFATKCAERDGLALNRLLARAAQQDPGHQVLVAVQVENEMPCYVDYSPAANEHIGEQVPNVLLEFLKSIDTPKHDPTKMGWFTWSRYHGNGSKTSGTWEEVFGKQPWPTDARKAMGAYYTGTYIEIVVRKAKEALDLPMYANAWCGESPCDCEYMDIFHVGCPSLDGMGPDNYGEVLHKYIRPWNVLVQPEFSPAEHYFRALSMGALLVGQYWQAEVELMRTKATFDLVRTMEPLLVQKRNPGDLLGFTSVLDKKLHKAGSTWEQDYGNLKVKFTATVDHLPGETEWRNSRLHTAGPLLNGNGLIIRMGWDEYVIVSTKIDVELRRADGSEIGIAWAERGHFEQGAWIKQGGAEVESLGRSLKLSFPTGNGQYGQTRLKLAAPAAK